MLTKEHLSSKLNRIATKDEDLSKILPHGVISLRVFSVTHVRRWPFLY